MLALNAGSYPLVNPAAFHYANGSVWMTTSRHAVKVALARRESAASFLVDGHDRCLLLDGSVEVLDPRSIPAQVRALLEGPALYLSLAGYALKNAAFVGGYLRDITGIPGDWWPQNRVVLRLRAERAWALPSGEPPAPDPAPVPGVPAGVRRSLARTPVAYLCTVVDEVPLLAPALWTASGEVAVVTGVAAFLGIGRKGSGGLVIESHHRYRATRMVGAYLRGRFTANPEAKVQVQERYGMAARPPGLGLHFRPERATWWRGFEIQSALIEDHPARRKAN